MALNQKAVSLKMPNELTNQKFLDTSQPGLSRQHRYGYAAAMIGLTNQRRELT